MIPMTAEITVTYKPIRKYECTNRAIKSKIRGIKIAFQNNKNRIVYRVYVVCDTHKSNLDCETWTEVITKARKPWEWCEKCRTLYDMKLESGV
jgi:hypothetical protein